MGSNFIHSNSNITKTFTFIGCAFLKFETKEQALAAIDALNGKHKMEVSQFSMFIKMCKLMFSPFLKEHVQIFPC